MAATDQDADSFASFDFLATYAPGGSQGAKTSRGTEDEDRDTKWRRPNQKGGRGKGQGQEHAQDQPSRKDWRKSKDNQSWDNSWSSSGDVSDLRQSLANVTRRLLRHEDALNLIKAEVGFVVHFGTNVDASVVGKIYLAQRGWRQLKESKPQDVDLPMRNTLLECVFQELKKRLSEIQENTDVFNGLTKAKWLKVDNGQEMKGDCVGFLLQLPIRGQATDELLGCINSLCSCSAT